MLRTRHHWSDDYIFAQTSDWREQRVNEIILHEVEQRRWDIVTSVLSHAPQSKEGANALNRKIQGIEKHLDGLVRLIEKKKARPKVDKENIKSSYTVVLDKGESLTGDLAGLDKTRVKRAKSQ